MHNIGIIQRNAVLSDIPVSKFHLLIFVGMTQYSILFSIRNTAGYSHRQYA